MHFQPSGGRLHFLACDSFLAHPDHCFPPHTSFYQTFLLASFFRRPCDYTGCPWTVQDNLLISRPLTQSYLQSPPPNITGSGSRAGAGEGGRLLHLGDHYSIYYSLHLLDPFCFFVFFFFFLSTQVRLCSKCLPWIIFTLTLEEGFC